MNIYSDYIDIKNDQITITFPVGFYRGKALLEITTISKDKAETISDTMNRDQFRKLLLQRPSKLTKDEIINFKNLSDWMSEWNPGKF